MCMVSYGINSMVIMVTTVKFGRLTLRVADGFRMVSFWVRIMDFKRLSELH